MALPPSGELSLLNIQGELGGSAPIAISEYYNSAENAPTVGQISIGDFYGLSAPPAEFQLYGSAGTNPLWSNFTNDIPWNSRSILNGANVDKSAVITYSGNPPDQFMRVEADNGQYAFQKMWSWDVRWSLSLSSIPVYLRNKRISIEVTGYTDGANNGEFYDLPVTIYTLNSSNGRTNILSFRPSNNYVNSTYVTANTVQQYIDGSAGGLLWLGQSAGGDGISNNLSGDSSMSDIGSYMVPQQLKLVV